MTQVNDGATAAEAGMGVCKIEKLGTENQMLWKFPRRYKPSPTRPSSRHVEKKTAKANIVCKAHWIVANQHGGGRFSRHRSETCAESDTERCFFKCIRILGSISRKYSREIFFANCVRVSGLQQKFQDSQACFYHTFTSTSRCSANLCLVYCVNET